MQYVGGEGALRFAGRTVQLYEFLRAGFQGRGGDRGGREGPDEEAVWVVLDDLTGREFCAADEGDSREDWSVWVRIEEGLFDVEAVLEEDERRVGV